MTRPATIKQADVTRAIKGAEAALGRPPSEVVFDRDGGFRLVYSEGAIGGAGNPLDRVLKR